MKKRLLFLVFLALIFLLCPVSGESTAPSEQAIHYQSPFIFVILLILIFIIASAAVYKYWKNKTNKN